MQLLRLCSVRLQRKNSSHYIFTVAYSSFVSSSNSCDTLHYHDCEEEKFHLFPSFSYFGASMASPQTLFLIFYVIAPWAPVLFLNFYYRSKVGPFSLFCWCFRSTFVQALKFLRDNTTHFSVELRRLQQQLIDASECLKARCNIGNDGRL